MQRQCCAKFLQNQSPLTLWRHPSPVHYLLTLGKWNMYSTSQIRYQHPKRNSGNQIFVPSPAPPKQGFNESPLKQTAAQGLDRQKLPVPYANVQKVFDDNLRFFRTGKFSGRTLECPKGKAALALRTLRKIERENYIWEEFMASKERLKPHEARRKLKSKRHRIRFKQGISRLVGIVMRMRNKSF